MAGIEHWKVTEPYLQIACGLGEAPFWEKETHHLRFVDIVKQKLHVIDLNKGPSSLISFDLDDPVGTTADIEGSKDEIIVGAKGGYAVLNRKTGGMEYLKKLWAAEEGAEKEKRMRSNDGAVDTSGRYWVGAMCDPKVTEPNDEGVLFRLDPDMKLHRMIENVTIPNGIGWSADDKTMYFTDSPTKTISKFDYDAATGHISNRRPHFKLEDAADDAVPDGFAMDVDGCIWTAVFGAGKVLRISPEGKVIGEVSLPTRCVACPGFAGEDLFITTAEEEDPDSYPESMRYAGSVFRVHVGVEGSPTHRFKRL